MWISLEQEYNTVYKWKLREMPVTRILCTTTLSQDEDKLKLF